MPASQPTSPAPVAHANIVRALPFVFAGGVIGGSLRYAFALVFPTLPGALPWTTFVENVTGAFLLGLLLVLLNNTARADSRHHAFFATGILGSFTTFSTFTLETLHLGRSGHPAIAFAYPLLSIAAGLIAAFAGMALAHRLVTCARKAAA